MLFLSASSILIASFSLIILIHLFFILFFFSRFVFYKEIEKPNPQFDGISIIICVKNGEKYLDPLLQNSCNQLVSKPFEVIVIDDASTDGTIHTIKRFKKQYPNTLRYKSLTKEEKKMAGKKYPLSQGIKMAKYEIVLLTDADCQPSTYHWASEMTNKINNTTSIVLGLSLIHI